MLKKLSEESCFEKARYAGIFNGGGLNDMGEASNKPDVLNAAFEFGKAL